MKQKKIYFVKELLFEDLSVSFNDWTNRVVDDIAGVPSDQLRQGVRHRLLRSLPRDRQLSS